MSGEAKPEATPKEAAADDKKPAVDLFNVVLHARYTFASTTEQAPRTLGHRPSPTAVAALAQPIYSFLESISCYDVMGNSTQVVVVEVKSLLPVAFMAAQESRVSACVLWDSAAQRFCGVMTVTDYIKVLLHCNEHPADVEKVTKMSIHAWREMTGVPNRELVAVSVDTPISKCLAMMAEHRINRLPVLVQHETSPTSSLVSMLNYSQLLGYLTQSLFPQGTDGGAPVDAANKLNFEVASTEEGAYKSLMDVQVGNLEIGHHTQRPTTMTLDTPLVEALKTITTEHVRAVAVVDPASQVIIEVMSRSDVMRTEHGGTFDIKVPLREALSFRIGGTVCVYRATDTLREVLLHFAKTGVKTLFCVDEKNAITGQLELSAVLRFIFSMGKKTAAPA